MLRPLVLAALAPAALAISAAVPAAAQGFAPPGHGGGGIHHGGQRGPGIVRGQGWRPPHHAGPGRHGRYGYAGYGYAGYGYGGYGGGIGTTVVNQGAGEVPDWGYRIVTAPGIEERQGSRPVVYVLDAPGRVRSARARFQPYGGPADPEYGPRVVSLSVPRR